MVGNALRDRIERFVRDVGEDVDVHYVKVEAVTLNQQTRMRERRYIETVVHRPDNSKTEILSVLEESWRAHMRDGREHGKARDWGRAASGFAHYLLKPTEVDEVDLGAAEDLVVRMSRWHHSNETVGIWIRFIPFAHGVVRLAWGDIEDLKSMQ